MASSHLKSPALVTLLALAGLFLVAYVADSFLSFLVKHAGETFVFLPAAIAKAAMPFLIVALVLAVAWLILIRLPPRASNAATALVAGLVLMVIYLPFLPFSFPMWLLNTPIGALRAKLWSFEAYPSIYYLAAACVVTGVVGIVRSRRRPFSSK